MDWSYNKLSQICDKNLELFLTSSKIKKFLMNKLLKTLEIDIKIFIHYYSLQSIFFFL